MTDHERVLTTTNIFECTAKLQDVGRESASICSSLKRDLNNSLHLIDENEKAYLHEKPGEIRGAWVELYAVPGGHGATFLGFFLTENFAIRGPI
ncbi:hypothetical protein [Roseibium album]|uniref:hypothetical protein n=1 Tax=Roseibium album TaxID=311410 RepID=UPI0024937D3B|nr:hypothetical protein [Roseibium album]